MSNPPPLNLALYEPADGSEPIEVVIDEEEVWASQKAMADIFDTDQSGIARHLSSIFASEELEEKLVMQKMHNKSSGKKISFYNLDAIISVGYKVNSKKATAFRQWANGIIKQYIRDGYVINEAALRGDPAKLNKLAAEIRRLRASEQNVFASVRECFKISASDYEPSSQEVRSFYALLQDKFHHAITRMTASALIMERADSEGENMGLVSFEDIFPKKAEATTGKNYLAEDELYRMHLLSEQFLIFAESSALMGKKLTMQQLHKKLDDLLKLNGFPVFGGHTDYIKDEANEHASREYARFIEIKKLQMLGVDVDFIDYDSGEYSEYQPEMDKISIRKLRGHFREKETLAIENHVDDTSPKKLN
jgi:hypothetical protein